MNLAPRLETVPVSSLPARRGEGIDRKIEKRFWTRRRIACLLGLSLGLGLVIPGALLLLRAQQAHVDSTVITLSEVGRGPLQESVSTIGTLLPRTTVYLDAVEGGRIEEIYVREGSVVAPGQPLLRLSNNDLQLRLINVDAQRLEQVNGLRDTRFRMEQSALAVRQQLAEMDYQIQRLERQANRNRVLFESQLIPQQEQERVQDELEYYRGKRDLTLETFRQDSLRQQSQIRQMEAGAQSMESSYEVIRKVMDNLVIKSPVAGQLTALNAEIGELRPAGFRLGQIDLLADGYKVRAGIDEFYSARVERGQKATTVPISGREYDMTITRVYPEVREGKFAVDLEFAGAVPENLRRGQTIGFQLKLGAPDEVVILPRGAFYQKTGGRWVYVLVGSHKAERRSIRLGRMSADSFEVVDGLKPGEKVITSSYDPLGDVSQLILD